MATSRIWVSIEAQLDKHPKIGAISKQVRKHRLYCVGAVARIWGMCLTFGQVEGDDVVLDGYDIYDIDKLADCRGFSAALIEAGWMKVVGRTQLVFLDLAEPLFINQMRRERDRVRQANKRRHDSANAVCHDGLSVDCPRTNRGLSEENPKPPIPNRTDTGKTTTTDVGRIASQGEAGSGRKSMQVTMLRLVQAFRWSSDEISSQRKGLRSQVKRLLENVPHATDEAIELAQQKSNEPDADFPVRCWWAEMKRRYPILEKSNGHVR